MYVVHNYKHYLKIMLGSIQYVFYLNTFLLGVESVTIVRSMTDHIYMIFFYTLITIDDVLKNKTCITLCSIHYTNILVFVLIKMQISNWFIFGSQQLYFSLCEYCLNVIYSFQIVIRS